MVRGHCCEKIGLKKGPWTPQEDHILISYIQQHGHENWRALPKQAGLPRCGKSCRLRWINYLRPDIKRGNFSKEEEESIIKLHEILGNRWSAIAARLPGRTDNEIKNVWNTHLKKRIKFYQDPKRQYYITTLKCDSNFSRQSEPQKSNFISPHEINSIEYGPVSPQLSSSEVSSITDSSAMATLTNNVVVSKHEKMDSSEIIEESFRSEELSAENFVQPTFSSIGDELELQFPLSGVTYSSKFDDGMDFWYDIFMGAEELPEF